MSGVLNPVAPLYSSLYFSVILSAGFYGVTCMQTFFYYIHCQEEPSRMKSFIAIVWALETIHQSLVISGVYKYIMAGLVNPTSFSIVIPELVWEPLLTSLVAVPTQGFFVYRIYIFSEKNIIVPLVWLPLGIFQLVAALLYVGKAAYVADLSTLRDTFFMDLFIAYCAAAAGVDILIAICLTYLLSRRRIGAGFKHAAKILQLFTVFAINSGIWTALFALLTVSLLRAFPTEFIHAVFAFPLCSIYCNTLLANLNARSYIKNQSSTPISGADLMSDFQVASMQHHTESSEPEAFLPTSQVSESHGVMSSTPTMDTNRSITVTAVM